MSTPSANTCQMCGGNGTVGNGGRRGGETTCGNCGGTGHIPRVAAIAAALVADWPPFTAAQRESIRRIARRGLAPTATPERRAA